MPDSASHRWSYYSARMRSAIALSNYSSEMSFSGKNTAFSVFSLYIKRDEFTKTGSGQTQGNLIVMRPSIQAIL